MRLKLDYCTSRNETEWERDGVSTVKARQWPQEAREWLKPAVGYRKRKCSDWASLDPTPASSPRARKSGPRLGVIFRERRKQAVRRFPPERGVRPRRYHGRRKGGRGPGQPRAAAPCTKEKAPPMSGTPYPPTDFLRSTFGEEGLNFRVRNGIG